MTDDTISIGELEALRTGWPERLTPMIDSDGEWDGAFDHSDNELEGEGYIECSGYAMDNARLFATLIAAEHNAAPVLLAIVRAALALREQEQVTARARLDCARMANPSDREYETIDREDRKFKQCRADYAAALSKVRP